jgi:pyruvate dehydrogenase E2 component (dihydrolipoamide acetyltransferase)
MEFRLPELGEGIDSGVVVEVKIQPGDVVKPGQEAFTVETDKSAMPIEVPAAGTVQSVNVKTGDKVKIGAVLAVLSGSAAAAAAPAPAPSAPVASAAPAPAALATPRAIPAIGKFDFPLPNLGEGIESGTVVAVLVKAGDVIKKDQELFTVETDKSAMPITAEGDAKVEDVRVKIGEKVSVGGVLAVLSGSTSAPAATVPTKVAPVAAAAPAAVAKTSNGPLGVVTTSGPVPAGPATRRYAREHGVSLAEVPGTARGGRVTVDDVIGHIRKKMSAPAVASGGSGVAIPPLPDFSKYGPIDKKPISNIRKKIAENLTVAWHVAPAVTQFDLADITDLEAGRKRIVEGLPKGAPKVTMTILAIKAVVAALKEFPNFNSSLDVAGGNQIIKNYYHIGIAVDTERGLVVPVIRDADKKSIRDLASDVMALAEKARTGKLTPDEMRGGTFTITNLGGVGGTAFSPIINYPEVAILGLARSSIQPAFRNNTFEARLMMPLCLTYDHRIIDGADGARFTTRLVQLFSDPIRLLMES